MTYEEIFHILSTGGVPDGCARHEDDEGVVFLADGYAVSDSDRRPVTFSDVAYDPTAQSPMALAQELAVTNPNRTTSHHMTLTTCVIGVRVTKWIVPHYLLGDADNANRNSVMPADAEFCAIDFQDCAVTVHPWEPKADHDHDWMPPSEILGDSERIDTRVMPGKWGVHREEWCAYCGAIKTTSVETKTTIEYQGASDESRSAAIQYQARKLADAAEGVHEEHADAFLDAFLHALQERVDLMGHVETQIAENEEYWARFVRLAAGVSGSVSEHGGAA